MTTAGNNFELGLADGTTITTANSGTNGNQAFDAVNLGAGAGAVISAAGKYRGSFGAAMTTGATSTTASLERIASHGVASTGQLYGRVYANIPALTFDANGTRLAVVTDSGGVFDCEWRINTVGQVQQRNSGGTVLGTTSSAITAGAWFRFEVAVLVFSGTVGQFGCRLFLNPESVTPTETLTSAANQNTLQGGGANGGRFGICRAVANLTTYLDDEAWSGDGWLGPSASHWSYGYEAVIG
jgi:hypothetical protein